MAHLRHRLTVPLVLVLLAGPLAGPGPVSGAGAPTGKHNGGDVQFGRDGLLYVGVGDGDGGGGPARDPATLYGKILRLTADGDIPDGNPYAGAAGARRCSPPTAAPRRAGPCQEVFALGLRNPFRLVFGPSSGTQALYYSTYARGGQVRRLAYSGPAPGRGSPTARAPAGVVTTAAGLGDGLVRGALLLDFTP